GGEVGDAVVGRVEAPVAGDRGDGAAGEEAVVDVGHVGQGDVGAAVPPQEAGQLRGQGGGEHRRGGAAVGPGHEGGLDQRPGGAGGGPGGRRRGLPPHHRRQAALVEQGAEGGGLVVGGTAGPTPDRAAAAQRLAGIVQAARRPRQEVRPDGGQAGRQRGRGGA